MENDIIFLISAIVAMITGAVFLCLMLYHIIRAREWVWGILNAMAGIPSLLFVWLTASAGQELWSSESMFAESLFCGLLSMLPGVVPLLTLLSGYMRRSEALKKGGNMGVSMNICCFMATMSLHYYFICTNVFSHVP